MEPVIVREVDLIYGTGVYLHQLAKRRGWLVVVIGVEAGM